jgi:AcrR family transcriptional regulator
MMGEVMTADSRKKVEPSGKPRKRSFSARSAPENGLVPRWRRRKDARPGELIDAALQVFVERGYSATRLDDVARRAGVTKGTMYRYFENKEALFKAMVRDRIVGHIAETETLLEGFEGSAREMLTMLATRWWERVVTGPMSGLARLIIGEVGLFPDLARFYHGEVILRNFKLFEHVIRLGMARGEFRRVDVAIASRLVVAPLFSAALWRQTFATRVEDDLDPARFFETHLDLFLRGLEVRPD